MFCIAITGGIACGKSTIANLFLQHGVNGLSADVVAKEITDNGGQCYQDIVTYFGDAIVDPQTQKLNRAKLRSLIFHNEDHRRWLETLTHPIICNTIEQRISHIAGPYCLIEIPLLVKPERYPYIKRVLLVTSQLENQIKRIQNRDNCGRADALAIIQAQPSLNEREPYADDVIHNDDDLQSLKQQIEKLNSHYLRLAK